MVPLSVPAPSALVSPTLAQSPSTGLHPLRCSSLHLHPASKIKSKLTRQSSLGWCAIKPSSVSCKRISSSGDIFESYFDYMILHNDPDLEDSKPIFLEDNLPYGEQFFLHDTPPHDDTPPYQVWLKIILWCRRYHLDEIGNTDKRTDGQTDGWTKWFQSFLHIGCITK